MIDVDDVWVGVVGYEFGITSFYIVITEASDEVKAMIDLIIVYE